jgi:3-oxoacyl-[acyl-carrier protein] reductase
VGLLDNKVALITGGSRGIGKAIALAFGAEGATVAFTYRQAVAEAEAVEDEIRQRGSESTAFQSDASKHEDARNVVGKIVNRFGKLDILVNNAGITRDNLLIRMSEEDWDAVIATNLKSVFNFTKAACKPMMSQRSGKIVNITSVAGVVGNAGQANYASAKAGMIGFTKTMAKELASRNICVNAIAPGFVETEMTAKLSEDQRKALMATVPMKRMGQPSDIASVAVFLASSASDYITGQVICIDGGMVM